PPGTAERIELHHAEGMPAILARPASSIAAGERVFYAIRPEKIVVGTEPDPERANHLQGKIVDIAYVGNISTYHVQLANGKVLTAQMTNARRLSRRDYHWDDTVWLSWTDTAGVVLTR
ncbi:TOBE domain-containing protein, partial [Thioclava sp. BHET1]